MPESLDFTYYDSKDVSTSASTWIEFFANTEAGSGPGITNMGTANQLPSNETFSVEEIHIMATPDIEINDVYELFEEGMIELNINNNRQIIFPALLAGCPGKCHVITEDLQDTTANTTASPTGGPFKLPKPIVIPGGTPFNVRFKTGATAAAAGDAIIIAMRGILDRR